MSPSKIPTPPSSTQYRIARIRGISPQKYVTQKKTRFLQSINWVLAVVDLSHIPGQ